LDELNNIILLLKIYSKKLDVSKSFFPKEKANKVNEPQIIILLKYTLLFTLKWFEIILYSSLYHNFQSLDA
jgi:hypothetical protein